MRMVDGAFVSGELFLGAKPCNGMAVHQFR